MKQPPRWSFHLDHPWSRCVREDGVPKRLNMWTPWGFIMIGEKSQVYDHRTKTWTDRWSYYTRHPR